MHLETGNMNSEQKNVTLSVVQYNKYLLVYDHCLYALHHVKHFYLCMLIKTPQNQLSYYHINFAEKQHDQCKVK